jgi:serine/threonine protein kinase
MEAPYCIVTTFIPNASLFNALREDPKSLKLNGTELTFIAYGIAQGMAHLHSLGLTHRDLKSQNILIDASKSPIICDFGSSRFHNPSQDLKTGEIGTPNYMAPEFIRADSYTAKVDVYSYAMILWEMLSRDIPFGNMVSAQVICQVLIHNKRPQIPPQTPEALVELIKFGWDTDPSVRPDFSAIVERFLPMVEIEGRPTFPSGWFGGGV